MKSPYIYLAHKTILFNKKLSFLATLLISFFMAFIIAVPLIFLSIEHYQDVYLTDRYGTYDTILFNIKSQGSEAISIHESIDEIGVFLNCGTYLPAGNSGNAFILGAMDEKALQLSNVTVSKGRIPMKHGEIALEKSMMISLNMPTTLEQIVSLSILSIDGTQIELSSYRVVGILEDYSKYQSNTIQGRSIYTSLPNCLVSMDDAKLLPNTINCLLSLIDKDAVGSIAQDLVSRLGLAEKFLINERYSSSVLHTLNNAANTIILRAFAMGIALIALFDIYCIYIVLYKMTCPTVSKIRLMGGYKQDIIKYALSVLLQIGILGMILGIIVLFFLLSAIKMFLQIFYSVRFTVVVNWYAIGLSAIIGAAILVTMFCFCGLSYCTINPLGQVSQYRKKRTPGFYKLNVRNPLILWGIKSAIYNCAEMVTVCIISSVGVALFIVCMFLHYGTKVDYPETIIADYCIMTQRNDSYTALRIPSDISAGISQADLNLFLSAQETSRVEALKKMQLNMIINDGDKNDSSINDIMQQKELGTQEPYEDFLELKEQFGYSKTCRLYSSTVFEVDGEILNQVKPYLKAGNINIDSLSSGDEILVITKNEDQPFHIGDKVNFTQLIIPEAGGLVENAQQFNLTTSIGGIIVLNDSHSDAFSLLTQGGYSFAFYGDTFLHLGLNVNYTNIYITLVDREKYQDIEPTILSIPDKYLEMKVISKRAQTEELTYVLNLIDATHITFLSIIFFSFFVSLFSVVHNRNVQRKRVYAVIRAIGISKPKLALFSCIETSLLTILSWAVGTIMAIIICFYLGDNWRSDWIQYFPKLALPVSFLALFCFSAIVSTFSVLYTQENTITDSLRYDG